MTSGPLRNAGIIEEALIYDALWRRSDGGVTPRQADQLLLWEIAVLLGTSDELTETAPTPQVDHLSAAKERNRQRMLHAKGEAPRPEAKPVNPDAFNTLTQALS